MLLRIFLALLALGIGQFIGFRFGIFGEKGLDLPSVTELSENVQNLPYVLQPTKRATPSAVASTSARVLLLDAPTQASTSQTLRIFWFVENPKIATISHTAIHYGKTAKPHPQNPNDYPEKSAILKGTIPATFSAELIIPTRGLYYYRTHAIIDGVNVWSEEKTIDIFSFVQSATSAATIQ